MRGYVENIERLSLENDYFRKVLYTDARLQLVVMSLNPGEDIGEEVHKLDQFLRIERGEGMTTLDGVSHPLADGSVVVVPAGVRHNIINTGAGAMKLYTLYAPPNHKSGVVHKTKAEARADEGEHFDGATSE